MKDTEINNNNTNEQTIYINIDDSGKLVNSEKVAVYAGLVFTSKKEKDKFITQYRSITENIKCNYCNKDISKCSSNKSCPELKHNMLKPKHNRQLMNYIKKYSILCCVINNDKVYSNIKNNTASRGRFLDYSLKLLIKQTLKSLIKENRINPNLPIRLILNIDEQTTKTNGYYNLKDGIIEELKYGIYNYNYSSLKTPIVNSDLEVNVCYQKSEKSYLIQASDLVAGTIRKLYLNNINDIMEFSKRIEFVNYKIFLP
jgi:hypothetical protein